MKVPLGGDTNVFWVASGIKAFPNKTGTALVNKGAAETS